MILFRVFFLVVASVFLVGCNNSPSGVSEAEANMSSEQYDAMIEAEESNRDA
jgi:uncharacterized protein YcfL